MEGTEGQVSTTGMFAGIAWGLATALILAGSITLLGWHSSLQARAIGLMLYAVSMLALAVASCLTVKCFMRKQTRYFINAVRLSREDGGGRVRQIR